MAAVQALKHDELYFRYGVTNIPKPEKAYKGGEDGYTASDSLLAVADGVGSSKDADKYSKQLVYNVNHLHEMDLSAGTTDLLKQAAKEDQQNGSSTVVLAKLAANDQL